MCVYDTAYLFLVYEKIFYDGEDKCSLIKSFLMQNIWMVFL